MRPPVLDFEKPWQKRCPDRCRDWVIIGATQHQLPSIISGCVLPSDRLVNWIVFHWLHTPLREKKKRNSMKRRQNPKDKQCHIGGVADSEENTSDDEEAPEKKQKQTLKSSRFVSLHHVTHQDSYGRFNENCFQISFICSGFGDVSAACQSWSCIYNEHTPNDITSKIPQLTKWVLTFTWVMVAAVFQLVVTLFFQFFQFLQT